jgi:hypothetical protein
VLACFYLELIYLDLICTLRLTRQPRPWPAVPGCLVRHWSWISSCVSFFLKKKLSWMSCRDASQCIVVILCVWRMTKEGYHYRSHTLCDFWTLLECFCWKLEDVAFFINPQILYWLMRWFRRHLCFTGSEKCIAFSAFWCYVCSFFWLGRERGG